MKKIHTLFPFFFLISPISAWVLHCDGPVPPSSGPRLLDFPTLTNLCSTYPYGLGLICGPNGEVIVGMPFANLWIGPPDPNYLATACLTGCQCADIEPDTPGMAVPPRPGQQNAVPIAQVIDMDQAAPLAERIHSCSDWYGSPQWGHCANVMGIMDQEFAAAGVDVVQSRQFVGEAVQSPSNGATILPKTYSFESCFVTFYFDSPQQSANQPWERLQVDFLDIVDDCVRTQGKGGLAPASPGHPINVVVYGAVSNEKRFRDQNTYSKIDTGGNAICGTLNSTTSSTDSVQNSYSSDGQTSVGSNCYTQKDCQSQVDSVCAYNGDVDMPIDSSWGKFTCTNVAHAGFAVAAALSWSNCYTGRCLLEADGTLFISQATGNATEVAVNGTSPTLDRYLELHQDSQIWKTVNESISASGNATGSNGANSAGSTSQNASIPAPLSADPFLCACNCTYFSRSCCLAPIVFEDASPQGKNSSFNQILKGPEGQCCDRDTGLLQDLSSSKYENTADKDGACIESA